MKERLDVLLVNRGLAPSREKAKTMIMEGNVFVKDTLALMEGCKVDGNLNIRRLSVELGSTFNGNCRMITESEFDKVAGVAAPKAPEQPAKPVQK